MSQYVYNKPNTTWKVPRCVCKRNLTCSLPSLDRFLIRQQLVCKYRTPVISIKYPLYIVHLQTFPKLCWDVSSGLYTTHQEPERVTRFDHLVSIPQLQGRQWTYDFSKSLSGCFGREELLSKAQWRMLWDSFFSVKGHKRPMISKSVMNQKILRWWVTEGNCSRQQINQLINQPFFGSILCWSHYLVLLSVHKMLL